MFHPLARIGCFRLVDETAAQRLFGRAIADVGAVEAGDETVFSADLQMFDDLCPGWRVCRGGEGNARQAGEDVCEAVEGAVFRPEIMAPLRNAVGLIDGDERERD